MLRSRKQVVLRVVWRLVACMFLAFLAMLISISATETDPTLLYFVAFAISSIMLPLACIWFVKVGERNYSLPLRLLLPLVYFGLLFSIPMTEWPLRFTLAIYQLSTNASETAAMILLCASPWLYINALYSDW